MVYYISNPEHREKVIVDCEYYWNEEYSSKNKRYEWNLDVRTTIIASNLLEELFPKIKSGEFTEEQLKELCKDIEDLRDLRMWLWEISNLNRDLDKTSPNTEASKYAERTGRDYIKNALETFANKWGYELYED